MTRPVKDPKRKRDRKPKPSLRKEAVKDLAPKHGTDHVKGGPATVKCGDPTN
jgi:hypothetical protein